MKEMDKANVLNRTEEAKKKKMNRFMKFLEDRQTFPEDLLKIDKRCRNLSYNKGAKL